LGWVELVIEGTFEVDDSGVVEVELVKWVELKEPSPWVDWSWSADSFDSNWGLG
jgi:hypothetical protein